MADELQIPLSGAGVIYAWNSAVVISMLTMGALTGTAFILYEWKIAPIPIMPCKFVELGPLGHKLTSFKLVRLFTAPHCAFLYMQTFAAGMCFFCNFFYCMSHPKPYN